MNFLKIATDEHVDRRHHGGQFTKVPNIAPNIASWVSKPLSVYLIARPYPFADLKTLWEITNSKVKFDAAVIEPSLALIA